MKITYYIDTIIPTKRANMVHVMKMCQAFSNLGHSVTLICDSSQRAVDPDLIRQQYGICDSFAIRTVYIPRFLRKYGHRFAAYYGAYRKSGMAEEGSCAYSRSAATLFFLRNRTCFVYEAHMEPDFLNRRIEYAVLTSKNCIGLVVISRALKQRYLELFPFLQPDFITVLHDAADLPEDTCEKARLQGPDSDIKIGYVGHLYPGKCMETLIPLAKRCPEYKFHIVGGTDEWIRHWQTRIREERIDNLLLYGYVDNREVGSYYRAFDIAIMPFSRTINIGRRKSANIGNWISPLKLFEAMAYGKPILVSRLPTIEEVLTDGKDCVMAEPDNIEQWAEKLRMLCRDAQLQTRIGTEAREKLRREHTWLERAERAAALFE